MDIKKYQRDYKILALAGKSEEAQKVLNIIRNYFEGIIEDTVKEVKSKKEIKEKKQEKIKEEKSLDELINIKGIGKKTLKDIKRIYSHIDELKQALNEDKVPLNDNIVIKLRKYLG